MRPRPLRHRDQADDVIVRHRARGTSRGHQGLRLEDRNIAFLDEERRKCRQGARGQQGRERHDVVQHTPQRLAVVVRTAQEKSGVRGAPVRKDDFSPPPVLRSRWRIPVKIVDRIIEGSQPGASGLAFAARHAVEGVHHPGEIARMDARLDRIGGKKYLALDIHVHAALSASTANMLFQNSAIQGTSHIRAALILELIDGQVLIDTVAKPVVNVLARLQMLRVRRKNGFTDTPVASVEAVNDAWPTVHGSGNTLGHDDLVVWLRNN